MDCVVSRKSSQDFYILLWSCIAGGDLKLTTSLYMRPSVDHVGSLPVDSDPAAAGWERMKEALLSRTSWEILSK